MKLARHITLFLTGLVSINTWAQTSEIEISSYTYKDTLQLDFYKPFVKSDGPRPLIVLMHGGGFAEGNRNGGGELKFCQAMAEKGYAVASISYRLTRKNDPFNCDCDTDKKMSSFVSACEDLSDAVHFMNNEKSLIFDRNTIVLVGNSAGAEAILHSAFMPHDYRFNHIPAFTISDVISFSGAILNAAYINENNAIPALLVHGKKDKLVPFATAAHHYCTEDKAGYLMLDGPKTIASSLKKKGGSYILAYDPEGGHELANEAYNQTKLVSQFMQELVLNKKFVQETIELLPAKTVDSSKN